MVFRRFIQAVILLAAASPAWSFPMPEIPFAPRTYHCRRASTAPVIDGRLDDDAWKMKPFTEAFVDIRGPSRAQPHLTTHAVMTWDDDCFYIGAALEEPNLWATLTERDAVIYHDNDFEVFIDPDGDNHHYYELEINALGTEWDLLLVRPYRDGGPAINAWDIPGLKTAVHLDGTLNDPSDTDRGWTVEIAIPWSALGEAAGRRSPPEPGDIWRVNFSRVQWKLEIADSRYAKLEGAAEDNWVWSPQGLVAMHYPEMWGEVMFIDDDAPGFEASAEHAAIAAAARLMPVYYAQREFHEKHGHYATYLDELEIDDVAAIEMTGSKDRFLARVAVPACTATVDESGRLARKP